MKCTKFYWGRNRRSNLFNISCWFHEFKLKHEMTISSVVAEIIALAVSPTHHSTIVSWCDVHFYDIIQSEIAVVLPVNKPLLIVDVPSVDFGMDSIGIVTTISSAFSRHSIRLCWCILQVTRLILITIMRAVFIFRARAKTIENTIRLYFIYVASLKITILLLKDDHSYFPIASRDDTAIRCCEEAYDFSMLTSLLPVIGGNEQLDYSTRIRSSSDEWVQIWLGM